MSARRRMSGPWIPTDPHGPSLRELRGAVAGIAGWRRPARSRAPAAARRRRPRRPAGLPHSRLAVLPGTAHVTMMEGADWLVPMIAEFLHATLPGCREETASRATDVSMRWDTPVFCPCPASELGAGPAPHPAAAMGGSIRTPACGCDSLQQRPPASRQECRCRCEWPEKICILFDVSPSCRGSAAGIR